MKYLGVILATAGLALAQNVNDYFPECSIKCLLDSVSSATDCAQDDGVCICIFDNYASIVDDSTNCVIQACGADVAINKVLPGADNYCKAVTAAASAHTASKTSTPAASGTAAATGSPSPSVTDAAASPPATTPAPTGSGSANAPPPATTTSSAGAANAGSVGLVAMLGLGALAAL
ncbi:hypothetical protein QBC33DRAFT_517912 [Phialemonium atrogriseum]|uniref:CFEM domain-containing protein n=1 Tax=Phialemonium atrogriseum TaxID=1093897 RepID=A0AAJ0BVQ8_9PEZI|nr:uncharacterized protein QBC33DRAFT_517912 [Phialemonium atrogriseum]KAK1764298.1 hypothetical protein QBC33DRAFT_517912 [Phialemonium atrogriseum]